MRMEPIIQSNVRVSRETSAALGDLTELYDTYSPRLYRYAYRLLGEAALAEDCVAEIFSRFLGALKKGIGPNSNVKAYLYRMAHNWITDFYRGQPPTEELDPSLESDPKESPPYRALENLERERVRKALLRLTPEQRQVVMLRFYEEWSHDEIAQAIGKTSEATRALQYRALSILRNDLIDEEE
jgi:RNA polymerase sigma-70 factor, ECF subfamily